MSDGLDLNQVAFHNSPDVRAWPATATITKLEFRPTGVHVEHTKRLGIPPAAWPNFRPAGWDGDLQFTLWIFLKIGGVWNGAGLIQFWQDCDQNGGPPEEFAKNWYYAADRWAPMTGHQPVPGELVGFMVSSGDARNNGNVSVSERSNVVTIPFPSSGGVYLAPETPDPQPPQPGPVPNDPDPSPIPIPADVLDLLKTTRDEIILTKLQGADILAVVNNLLSVVTTLTATVNDLVDIAKADEPPDYAGTLSIKLLGRDQTANIFLKPTVAR